DQVDLALHEVRPGWGVRVFEVRHEHARTRVERVDQHLAVGWAGDLDPPVLEVPGSPSNPPFRGPYRVSVRQELRRLAGIQACLPLVALSQQLQAPLAELTLKTSHEGQRVGREHLGGPP